MKRAWLAGVLVMGIAACAKKRPGEIPNIRYGADVCVRCGMILSEERFAAGYVDEQGKNIVYDDVGEFLQDAAKNPAIIPNSFVHDAENVSWLKASAAIFVKVGGLATPMGSGFAAFASEDRARAFSRRLGGAAQVLSIDEASNGGRSAHGKYGVGAHPSD